MSLSDADLVRAHRGNPNTQTAILNPGHVAGLRRVEAAAKDELFTTVQAALYSVDLGMGNHRKGDILQAIEKAVLDNTPANR